jgi:membrane associated rhomboid family serine protease
VSDTKPLSAELLKRGITGLVLGLIAGAFQVWFLKQDFSHLWASMAAGVLYMTTWVLFTEWLRLAGGRILLGAVSGLIAAMVWWAIAMPAENVFLQAAVAGMCFGATYAWSDRRMT